MTTANDNRDPDCSIEGQCYN